jgi:hypothetical protein
MKSYHRFDDLPGKKGYGVVFHYNKEEMIHKTQQLNWGDDGFQKLTVQFAYRDFFQTVET